MLSYDPNRARQAANVRTMDLAGKVGLVPLGRQLGCAAHLLSPAFLTSLQKAVEAQGKLDRRWIVRRQTPHGMIAIAGTAANVHNREDYAFLLDLGGNDVYLNNQGSSVPGQIPTAVFIDLAGDDTYEATEPLSQGAGNLGVGILLDRKGNDRYLGRRLAQGAAFCGIGFLIDEAGDDVYRAVQLSQGIAAWGTGFLIDLAGDDRYEVMIAGQGVGLPGGFGALHDVAGSDRYLCKGAQQTGYGTRNVFEGWGQGMGIGFRPYASGGVGVLVDSAGADTYEAGNFSQGCGYFYGFGILHDRGKEGDRYIGSRYCQGIGCHQAAGAFIEAGGDDFYTTRSTHTAQGFTWDESVALFLEAGGDDTYESVGNSYGAAAMNGWTIFLEMGGNDRYGHASPAKAGPNFYHGGTSMAIFLDAGGGEDRFGRGENNRIRTAAGNSIFIDLPGGIDDALKADAWRRLLPPPATAPAGK